MRRHILGIVALCLLITGAVMLLRSFGEDAGAAASKDFAASMCLRIGWVLAAIWLAYPELKYIPPWMYTIVLAAVVIVVIQPKTIVFVIPALLLIWLLNPKRGKR